VTEEEPSNGASSPAPVRDQVVANPKKDDGVHDFDQYERLLTAARKRSADTYLDGVVGR